MSNWKAWEQEFLANADNPAFGLPKHVPTPTMVDKRPQQAAPEEKSSNWDRAKDWAAKAGEDIAKTVGRSYLWSKEDYNRRAKELATRMGVDADVVSAAGQESLEAWERTFDVMETGKRADEFARVWSDWDDISATDRAIRVHNYAPIHETMGVVENALRGVRQMDAQLKMSALGDEKMTREEQGLDTTEIDERIRELAVYAQAQTGDDVFIHDTAGQVYMTADMTARSGKEMLVGAGTGALAGAAAGGAAGGIGALPGAYAGFWSGAFLGWNMGQANRMNEMSRGLAYIEARQGGEYGRMSVQDAATYAKAVGISEAALEFGTGIIGAKALAMGRRVVGKVTGKTAADDIIRRAARAIATETNIKDAAKTFLKAGAMSAGAEITEEVLQEAAGNAVWNAIATGTNGARKIPLAELVANSLQAGWDAAPAVLGMSMLMGAGANVRFVNKAAHMMLPEFQMQKEAITNAVGQRMVADLLSDKDTNALFKKDPALYAETVQQAANDAGVGTFWADAQTLMASEKGRGALNSLVREGVITQEAMETAVQTEGRIEVPVGTYLQADLTEDERAATQTATTWTEGGMLPDELDERRKALAVSKYAAALEEEMQRTADAIEHVVADTFSTHTDSEKDIVREVMAASPRNLREGYKAVRQSLIEALEAITGDVEDMRRHHGEGVNFIPFDGDGAQVSPDSMEIHYSRRSSENELWYSKFYERYGRAPRWSEYYDIALDEMKEDIERVHGTPEYDEGMAEYNRGKELYERLEALEGLRDDLYAVQDTGMLTLRAALSEDGLAVYQRVHDILTSVGGETAEAADEAAFLWAKRAETFARIMQDMGRNDFTARDYLEMHPIFAEDTFGAGEKASGQYWQAMYRSKANSLVEFVENVERDPVRVGKAFYQIGTGENTIDVSSSAVQHVQGGHHPLTPHEWQELEDRIGVLTDARIVLDKGKDRIVRVQGKIKTPTTCFGVFIKFSKKGNRLVTAFTTSEKGVDAWMQKKDSRVLSDLMPGLFSGNPFSIANIAKALREVKNENGDIYLQADEAPSSRRQRQLELILAANPMQDDYHVGVRTVADIRLPEEVFGAQGQADEENYVYPDFTSEDGAAALSAGEITVYSSHPIEDGGFVTPSSMMAKDYAGSGKVYSKRVPVEDVAWLTSDEGQYASVEDTFFQAENDIGRWDITGAAGYQAKSNWTKAEIIRGFGVLYADLANPNGVAARTGLTITPAITLEEIESLPRRLLAEHFLRFHQRHRTRKGKFLYDAYGVDPSALLKPLSYYQDLMNSGKASPTQARNRRIVRGMTSLENGKRAMTLFRDGANYSTFIHESGHIFLEDLRLLAESEDAPAWLARDWETVKAWTGWKDGAADNTKAHEKFARGFEAYVREGNAPTKDLRGVFRTFRKWLTAVYETLINLGEVPPKDVQRVMERMLATQDAIDAYTAERALDEMAKADEKLAAARGNLVDGLYEKVLEELNDIEERESNELLETLMTVWLDRRKAELAELPVYRHEAQREAFREELLAPDALQERVMKRLASGEGQALYSAKELAAIEKKKRELSVRYMALLRELDGETEPRRLHDGELPESPTLAELLAKPDVNIAEVVVPDTTEEVSAALTEKEKERHKLFSLWRKGESFGELRKKTLTWIHNYVTGIGGTAYENVEIGDIEVAGKGVKHTLRYARRPETLLLFTGIDTIVKNGIITQIQEPKTPDGNIKRTYIMYTPAVFGGNAYIVRSVIKEMHDGKRFYHGQAWEIEKDQASWSIPAPQKAVIGPSYPGKAFSTISVEELLKFVKDKDKPLPGGPTNRDRIRQVLRFLRDELPDGAGAKDAVRELEARVRKLKDTDTAALDEEKERLKGLLQERLNGLRLVRDSTKGQVRRIEARAKDAIAQGTVGAAYTWKTYQNKVAYYSRLAAEATARGAYAEAAEMKQRELYHAYLAKHAVAAREQIEKDKRRLADNLKRITRKDAPVVMDVQSRYFIEHLMYRLGLTQTDAVMPADGFELAAVARLLDVDAQFGMAGSEVIPESVRQLLAGGRRDENAWRHIRVGEWEEIAETLTVVYKVGRRAQEGVTIKDAQGKNVAIADAATELAQDLAKRFGQDERDLRRIEQERTLVDKVVHAGAGLLAELIKPEVILNRLDGRAGSHGAGLFHRYIYMPIEQAMNKKREMTVQGKKELHAIFERRYSASELREMRTKRKYAVGARERYTKEEILCAALNWGTKQNRQRTCFTFGVGERDMLQVFEDVLDSRDWDTVEAVWALLDSYFDERSRINERERGVAIAKVEPLGFSVGGRHFAGGYYPIVYDPQLSVRASDLEVAQELTRQMSSNAVFGSGLSATKKRQAVVHRELFLSLDVIPRAMNEAILHISMREAVLDVAHLLDHENLAEPLQKIIGVSQYRALRQWVRDSWREDTDIAKGLEMVAETLRRNSVFAVMAYRTSTAALNICNFPMAMWEIGPVRFLQALQRFYRHPQQTARAIKAKSSFLAEREENLDRDLARGMRIGGKETTAMGVTLPVGAAVDAKAQIDRFGYYAITKTDLMLSYPAWQARYEDTVRELIDAGETDVERIEREAIARADEAVRRVWGSGETKDMARVQKGHIMKYFTPFYTFFSTVLNTHIEAGYALKDRGDVRPLISTVFAWIIVQAAMETLLRMAIDAATGRGDDDDFYATFLKEYARNATGTLVGGLPIVRDAVNGLTMQLTGEYFPSRGSQVVALRILEDMADFTAALASDKKDRIDVGRSGARVMNRLVGFSDTLTDGVFTFTRFALTDTQATWDEAVAAMVFDRKLKKGK